MTAPTRFSSLSAIREAAVLAYCEPRGVDGPQRRLLEAVLDGHRGRELARAVGVDADALETRERAFAIACGHSVYEAAVEVILLAGRIRRSSRPPPARP